MRTRLRPRYEDEAAFYAERYPAGYDHRVWPDHVERVDETVRFATGALAGSGVEWVADLSCGDGALTVRLAKTLGAGRITVADLNPDSSRGVIRESLPGSLRVLKSVDLYVCSETLEHLDDPDGFLRALRPKTRYLVLTTPEGEGTAGNPEHYWGWDSEDVEWMLAAAGFTYVLACQVFTPQYRTPDVIPTQMWIIR